MRTTVPNEPISNWPNIRNWPNISRLLLSNQDALGPPLRRDFLVVVNYLRRVDTPKGRYLLDFWPGLGRATGVDEQSLRDAIDREQKTEQGGLVGCSWLRCAMYEQDSVRDTFFMCFGCRKAMYCGLSCQDR